MEEQNEVIDRYVEPFIGGGAVLIDIIQKYHVKELAKYYCELNNKKAKLMLSNSNPKNTNKEDNFFDDIYKGFNINEVSAKRMINANSNSYERYEIKSYYC